jgi:hypothetical protein
LGRELKSNDEAGVVITAPSARISCECRDCMDQCAAFLVRVKA